MSAKFERAPLASHNEWRRWHEARSNFRQAKKRTKGAARTDAILPPVKIFSLSLRRAASGRTLRDARHVGWGHIGTPFGERSIGEIHSLGRRHRVTRIIPPNPARRLIRTLQRASKKSVGGTSHALRLLKVPPLVATAIWLHGRRQTEDLVTVMHACVPMLRPSRTYGVADFLSRLREPARGLLKASKLLRGVPHSSKR
jgi:hypothetical protein